MFTLDYITMRLQAGLGYPIYMKSFDGRVQLFFESKIYEHIVDSLLHLQKATESDCLVSVSLLVLKNACSFFCFPAGSKLVMHHVQWVPRSSRHLKINESMNWMTTPICSNCCVSLVPLRLTHPRWTCEICFEPTFLMWCARTLNAALGCKCSLDRMWPQIMAF